MPSATSSLGHGWLRALAYRQLLLGVLFVAAFLILDGSSTASQGWEGAPPWYLPVGLSSGFAFVWEAGAMCPWCSSPA